jgi:nucleotidyltransferase AbiEii toxin of type IV toxin-antitoxin system
MAESYLALSRSDRLDALGVAATKSGRPAHLLEKDVMVVWAVEGLFASTVGGYLVFKGGTSLSKGYGIIKRFSEDIDVTYDVRQIIPDLAKGDAPLPATNAEARRWRDAIDKTLPVWVKKTALLILQKHADDAKLKVALAADGTNLLVDYDHVAAGYGYVPPRVKLEFGARSTGEPAEVKEIQCDALGQVDGVTFHRPNRGSCCRNGLSGKKRLLCTCSARKS